MYGEYKQFSQAKACGIVYVRVLKQSDPFFTQTFPPVSY